jgi:hypothetical protein
MKLLEGLTPKPKPKKITWTEREERTFRWLLSRTPVDARHAASPGRAVISVKPRNLGLFEIQCKEHGIAECEVVRVAIRFLRDNPGEYLKFVH